jgi:hypothetical protein
MGEHMDITPVTRKLCISLYYVFITFPASFSLFERTILCWFHPDIGVYLNNRICNGITKHLWFVSMKLNDSGETLPKDSLFSDNSRLQSGRHRCGENSTTQVFSVLAHTSRAGTGAFSQ